MSIGKKEKKVIKMVMIKIIEDCNENKKGEIVNFSKSSAKDIIDAGLGVYLDEYNDFLIPNFIAKCAEHNINLWAKERGYDPKVLQELNIGICKPEVYSEMLQEFGREELEKQGLIKSGKHKFVNRIIIPYNANYFSARAFNKDTLPKNLFIAGQKKQLYFIKGETDRCFVYEGETSFIAGKHIYPKDFHCAIGGTGSHALLIQLKTIFKGTKIIFCYDNDVAGKDCLEKSIKHLKKFKLFKLDLPEEFNDIDDWHKVKGKQELKEIKIESKVEKKQSTITIKGKGFEVGERNNALFNLAVKSKKEGKKLIETKEIIKKINEKNNPPLKEEEVAAIIQSAYKNKSKKDEEPIYLSAFVNENYIIEQVHDGECKFAIYNVQEDSVSYEDSFEMDGLTYEPLQGEEILKKAVLLPSLAEDYGSHDTLIAEIKQFINKWVDIPETMVQFAIWNIKRSWVFDKFHTLNYLRALGDTGQGKTRFLDTLGAIHYKPIATSGATTSAPIFRIINKWRGTLIMDEADFQKSDESQDIIKIINMGYEKGKHIMRCDQNDASKISFFDPFCPKILATRKTFTDKAVESRCITQVMLGTQRQDIPYNLTEEFWEESKHIRNMLLMWRFKNYYKIDADKKVDLGLGNLEPRVKQIVNSVVSLFNERTEEFEKFKEFILKYQEDLIDERKNSFEGQIVEAIYELVRDNNEHISSQDIIERGNITNRNGHFIKPQKLSSSLKSLGFEKSTVYKVMGKAKRCIPLDVVGHLNPLFERYGYKVTKVTPYTETPQNPNLTIIDDFKKLRSPHKGCNSCNLVTFFNDKNEKRDPLDVVGDAINSGFVTFEGLKGKLMLQDDQLKLILDTLKSKGDIYETKPDKWALI